ncbi:MAG: organic solvent tolerance protein OstA [Crocinitomicaceae bacterium]|nr:organic solvent tolerance protein OstA [Crocinitomicaceae bacterium]
MGRPEQEPNNIARRNIGLSNILLNSSYYCAVCNCRISLKDISITTLFVVIGFFSFSQNTNEQIKSNRIQIVNAERLIKSKNSSAQKFIGNVELKHQEVKLFCDSAFLYLDSNSLDAFGKVKILQGDSLAMYGDTLHYSGNSKLATMQGNVNLTDRNLSLSTTSMTYNLRDSVGHYTSGATITSTENSNVLTSKIGLYFVGSQVFEFQDSVELSNPEYTMTSDTLTYQTATETAIFSGPTFIRADSNLIYTENGWYDTKNNLASFQENSYLEADGQVLTGDSLFYDRNLGFGEVFNNMQIRDTANTFVIQGNYGWHNEKQEQSLITDSLLLIQIFENDSLFLHADTAVINIDSTDGKIIQAFHDVKFFKSDLQGAADSMLITQSNSTINMYENPILWSDENQLFADFISIKSDSNTIRSMLLDNNAFLISVADTFGFNQVKGRIMNAYFSNQKLKRLEVVGNAQSVYYVGEEEKTPIGMNHAVCSNMTLVIDENKVDQITFREKPEAVLYPMDDINPKIRLLVGFRWEEDLRPKQLTDIFR